MSEETHEQKQGHGDEEEELVSMKPGTPGGMVALAEGLAGVKLLLELINLCVGLGIAKEELGFAEEVNGLRIVVLALVEVCEAVGLYLSEGAEGV